MPVISTLNVSKLLREIVFRDHTVEFSYLPETGFPIIFTIAFTEVVLPISSIPALQLNS